jgi:hypothetical protein
MFDIGSAGPVGGALLRGLASGEIKPTEAGNYLLNIREATIREQYKYQPEEMQKQLVAFEEDKKRIREETMPNLLRNLFSSENYTGQTEKGTFSIQQLFNEYMVDRMRDAQKYVKYSHEFPVGGRETAIRVAFMRKMKAQTMPEAMDKSDFIDRFLFNRDVGKLSPFERFKPTDPAEINRLRGEAIAAEGFYNTSDPAKLASFAANNPLIAQILAKFDSAMSKRAAPIERIDQLNAAGIYEPGITQSSFFANPAVDEFVKTVGEGQKSLTRVPEFAEKIRSILDKAATDAGQAEIAGLLRQLQVTPQNGKAPTMTLSNGDVE